MIKYVKITGYEYDDTIGYDKILSEVCGFDSRECHDIGIPLKVLRMVYNFVRAFI